VAIVPGLSLVDPKPLPAKLRLLKAGITTPVQGFAPLPYVEAELAALGEQFAGALLIDESFDEASLRRELNDKPYDALHIASHAQFGSQLDQTFLVTYDGTLNISELAELVAATRFRDRPLELLSLSACETAVGDERSALGLAGASLKAGARSTLATLWFVNDLAASELVRDFYGELRAQTSRARALQQAQLRMMERRELRHPAHWSGFVIIGAWL
jgi:CHAT domain-containing protein